MHIFQTSYAVFMSEYKIRASLGIQDVANLDQNKISPFYGDFGPKPLMTPLPQPKNVFYWGSKEKG